MAIYACFLHPKEKGHELEETCPVCGRPFGFPLESDTVPVSIGGMTVKRALSRGFYGAVYEVVHPFLNQRFAVKVIPTLMYAPENYGERHNIREEVELWTKLTQARVVAALQGGGEYEDVAFGADLTIQCHWLQMEYVEGETLRKLKEKGPKSSLQIAQAAIDLLYFAEVLERLHLSHNDLHADNVKVVAVPPDDPIPRDDTVDATTRLKVLDLNSMSHDGAAPADRPRDITRIVGHVLDLLAAYRRTHPDVRADDDRLRYQLERVFAHFNEEDVQRRPMYGDLRRRIRSAVAFSAQPNTHKPVLHEMDEHYNAQTMDPWWAPYLMHDPEGEWERQLTIPGPTVVHGMRGCGKTLLLMSLTWSSRLQSRRDDSNVPESHQEVTDRVGGEPFVGFLVSCRQLLNLKAEERSLYPQPLRMLFLAYVIEIVESLNVSEVEGFGRVHYSGLHDFFELVRRVAPWVSEPTSLLDLSALQMALTDAWNNPMFETALDVSADVFEELAARTRELLDLWTGKRVFFLLDDVSRRNLRSDNDAHAFLSTLSIQKVGFAFKMSTESHTLQLATQGGVPAQTDRDYRKFDLGREVLKRLRQKGRAGADFIDEILYRREKYLTGRVASRPRQVLGSQSRNDIARSIYEYEQQRRSGGSGPTSCTAYWGIEALAALCTGDIGDIIQLYRRIVERASDTLPIPPKVQHDVMTEFCDDKLMYLADNRKLQQHAFEFARAAHDELVESPLAKDPRAYRQSCRLDVVIEGGAGAYADVYEQVSRLVEGGVFVLDGVSPRRRTTSGPPALVLKLLFRKALGLNQLIPLGWRHRFEIPPPPIQDWLEEPTAEKLRAKKRATARRPGAAGAEAPVSRCEPRGQQSFVLAPKRSRGFVLPDDRVFGRIVSSTPLSGVDSVNFDWATKRVVAAAGFEPRSLGAWENLLEAGCRPRGVILLKYPGDAGLFEDITKLLKAHGIPCEPVEAGGEDYSTLSGGLFDTARGEDYVVDTTSLTKALIYGLVLRSLETKNEAHVLHTSAAAYLPYDKDLRHVHALLKEDRWSDAFESLQELSWGEEGPYSLVPIGRQFREPGHRNVLVAFIPLRLERLSKLIDLRDPDRVVAVALEHSSGSSSVRSKVGVFLARFYAGQKSGTAESVQSLDHVGTLELLKRLYREHTLEAGHNLEIGLTGSKMQAVGSAMFGSLVSPAGVFYSSPANFVGRKYTDGTGSTGLASISRSNLATDRSE